MKKFILFIKTIIKHWKYIIPSIYFNFKHLPIKQAFLLPIILNKPHCNNLSGKIIIESDEITTGMIQLGVFCCRMYPNTGIQISNEGKLIFKGKCTIGNNSFIVTGKNGCIIFGNEFVASSSLRISSFCGIEFGTGTQIGWECIFMDTNFHPLYDIEKEIFRKAYGKIKIGNYNWFCNSCLIMHSVETPERCIFGARSILHRSNKFEAYCVHGDSPLKILARNVMIINGQEHITDYN